MLRGETVADESAAQTKKAKTTKPAQRKMSAQGLANIRAGIKNRWAMAKRAAAAAKKVVTKKVSARVKKGATTKGTSKRTVKRTAKEAAKSVAPEVSATS